MRERLRFFVRALSAFPDTTHAADFAVSKAIFAAVNPRLNPRGHAFHQHTDFERADRHPCRRLREKAGVSDDSFRNEFCNDCDHDDVVLV
ncbi:hypothetical protein QWJ07_09385 [Frankia sp. RB7]|nr:hypothetical protein [Frankia sp. RB7]